MPEKDYSHRAVVDKLGVKPGAAVRVVGGGAGAAGGMWVLTAKRGRRSASGMDYLNQSDVILLGPAAGLVDNKSCSVSEQESGLRSVIRLSER
ncbi:MAG: hypothetical protein IT317_00245 [Anaerolineales bacterium]|nr:hypothetical protein [Anaerolineales bacterium]